MGKDIRTVGFAEPVFFIYDYEKFNHDGYNRKKISKYGVTSFCTPPTFYSHIIKRDFSKYDLSRFKKSNR